MRFRKGVLATIGIPFEVDVTMSTMEQLVKELKQRVFGIAGVLEASGNIKGRGGLNLHYRKFLTFWMRRFSIRKCHWHEH
jgi:hypothetical protein